MLVSFVMLLFCMFVIIMVMIDFLVVFGVLIIMFDSGKFWKV